MPTGSQPSQPDPGRASDVAPDVAPDGAPDVALDVSPDVAPDVAPSIAPDVAPGCWLIAGSWTRRQPPGQISQIICNAIVNMLGL